MALDFLELSVAQGEMLLFFSWAQPGPPRTVASSRPAGGARLGS
jgi:hypothetical protein